MWPLAKFTSLFSQSYFCIRYFISKKKKKKTDVEFFFFNEGIVISLDEYVLLASASYRLARVLNSKSSTSSTRAQ